MTKYHFELPENWITSSLGNVSDWAIGSGFPTIYQGGQSGEIPFCKVSDMNLSPNTKYIIETNNYISLETAKKIKANLHPAGTIIFPKIGGAIATNKRRVLTKPSAIDNNCLGVIPNGILSVEFLYLLLSSIDFTEYQVGTSVPALSQGTLSNILVCVPPLSEQERIVAKVDELMALCDQLEQQSYQQLDAHNQLVDALLATLTQSQNADELASNWQRLAAHFDTLFTTEYSIDALKQAILQLAVMGKLVKQDPNDEPASELLKRIVEEKDALVKAGKIKKQKPLPPISDEEKPFELPEGWEWCRLAAISYLKGGFAYKSSEFISEGTAQVIRMGNIRPDYLRLDENPVFISDDYAQSTKDYEVVNGEIVLTMTGTKGKRDYLYSVLVEQVHLKECSLYLNQRLCSARPVITSPEFLSIALKDSRLLDLIYVKSTGSANQANIGMDAISHWLIPLPPLSEQYKIILKLNELKVLIERLVGHFVLFKKTQAELAEALVEQVVN